ncbi:MAG: DUF4294 domain-containing protein [Prolixibacteraceae bacterium]|nr:DUF4294 domain-containing protein [Prolixibacteraceae bacterium]
MTRLFFFILTVTLVTFAAQAQKTPDPQYVPGMLIGNDTLPHLDLPSVDVFPKKSFKSKNEEQQYWRLVWRVKKVLPYAKEAAFLMKKYEMEVSPDARGKDRRVYVRKAEEELMKKYGSTLKNMSVNDGKVLIKLIDRETSKLSYDLIHELKGGVSAVFWQGVARLFGNNLKSHYDPWGEDRQIELIIQSIEMGII